MEIQHYIEREPVGCFHMSNQNGKRKMLPSWFLSSIYPPPEKGPFISLSHHLKQTQMNVLSCLRKGNDEPGLCIP